VVLFVFLGAATAEASGRYRSAAIDAERSGNGCDNVLGNHKIATLTATSVFAGGIQTVVVTGECLYERDDPIIVSVGHLPVYESGTDAEMLWDATGCIIQEADPPGTWVATCTLPERLSDGSYTVCTRYEGHKPRDYACTGLTVTQRLRDDLSAETLRAQAAEAANTGAIDDLRIESRAGDARNLNLILAEEARAIAAEGVNAGAIAAEEARAIAAEAVNAAAIEAETNRATAAETDNATAIEELQSGLQLLPPSADPGVPADPTKPEPVAMVPPTTETGELVPVSLGTVDQPFKDLAITGQTLRMVEQSPDGSQVVTSMKSSATGFQVDTDGVESLMYDTGATGDTAIGAGALAKSTNQNNIALGNKAGSLVTGDNNIMIGNAGNLADTGVIRIGDPSTHTTTHLTGDVLVDGLRVATFGGSGPMANLNLGNNAIEGVDQLFINDPGTDEGILWNNTLGNQGPGVGAKIVVQPLNNTNFDGYLRIINDDGISLEPNNALGVRVDGDLSLDAAAPSSLGAGRHLVFNGNRPAHVWLDDVCSSTSTSLAVCDFTATAGQANAQSNLYLAVHSPDKSINFGARNSRANFDRWMFVRNGNLWLKGTITIGGGSDLSENFELAEPISSGAPNEVGPGTVLCIDAKNPGKLATCAYAYDRSVAGVVSGAGGIHPGMIMSQTDSIATGDTPVALTGRVYVKADATSAPIRPGDLLTTADTPGFAQRVSEHDRSVGAILGKAMTGLERGQGLILVLVSLQ